MVYIYGMSHVAKQQWKILIDEDKHCLRCGNREEFKAVNTNNFFWNMLGSNYNCYNIVITRKCNNKDQGSVSQCRRQ